MIKNRVANSPLVSLDMKDFYTEGKRVLIDIKPWLFQEVILKEKDFRTHLKEQDWSQYDGCYVSVTCSSDAIIPMWAYMLIASKLEGYAKKTVFGDLRKLEEVLFSEKILAFDKTELLDKKLVIKGCGDIDVPESAFIELTQKLQPVASSIMFGEPCSTVPVFKRKKS
ncbi:MAG: DUF2480 family protein [Bacteroidota bacterium]